MRTTTVIKKVLFCKSLKIDIVEQLAVDSHVQHYTHFFVLF